MSRREEISLKLNQLLDGTLLGLVFYGCHGLRFWVGERFDEIGTIATFDTYLWLLAVIVPLGPILLEIQGFYNHPFRKRRGESIRQVGKAMVWMAVVFGLCVVFFKWIAESRAVLLSFMGVGGVAVLLREAALRLALRKEVMSRAARRERVVIAGGEADMTRMLENMTEDQRLAIEVVDRIDLKAGSAEDLRACFRERSVHRVLFAADHLHFREVEEAIRVCEMEGVEAWLSADFINPTISRMNVESLGQTPMLVFRSTPDQDWSLLVKEMADRVFGIALFVFALPIMALAILGVRLVSPGAPAIFTQSRGGRYGRPFTMYKIRTMHPDADSEDSRAALALENEADGPAFKNGADPRIFALGAIFRKLSIDELPQLLNVIRGEMSLVGPRPLPIYEVEKISESSQRRRLSVRPGLTCLWQVSGRSNITSFEDWVRLDLEYIDNWSLWMDWKILMRTVPVVLTGAGAK